VSVLAPIAAAITFLSTMAGGYAALRRPRRIELPPPSACWLRRQ
jgi:hypothetical protein